MSTTDLLAVDPIAWCKALEHVERMARAANVKCVRSAQDPNGPTVQIEACWVVAVHPDDETAARSQVDFLPAAQYRTLLPLEDEFGLLRHGGARLILDPNQEPGRPTLYGDGERTFRLAKGA